MKKQDRALLTLAGLAAACLLVFWLTRPLVGAARCAGPAAERRGDLHAGRGAD